MMVDCTLYIGDNPLSNEVNKQNAEFAQLTTAEATYRSDGDIEKLIAAYEDVFITNKSTIVTQSRWFNFVDLYLKSGQNDKAWAWLNQLAVQHPDYMSKLRINDIKC